MEAWGYVGMVLLCWQDASQEQQLEGLPAEL